MCKRPVFLNGRENMPLLVMDDRVSSAGSPL